MNKYSVINMILSELDELIAILSPALIAAFVGFIRYFHEETPFGAFLEIIKFTFLAGIVLAFPIGLIRDAFSPPQGNMGGLVIWLPFFTIITSSIIGAITGIIAALSLALRQNDNEAEN